MTTPIQVDPLAVPKGLSLAERIWWEGTAAKIRGLKAKGDEEFRRGVRSHARAEQARADHARLQQENRERFAARGQDYVTADFHFAAYTVRQDCIESEQMYSRWAQENFAASNAYSKQVLALMNELRDFMQARRRPSPVPRPRGEGR